MSKCPEMRKGESTLDFLERYRAWLQEPDDIDWKTVVWDEEIDDRPLPVNDEEEFHTMRNK